MFDLLDLWLLRRGIPTDDSTLTFRRVDGNPQSTVVYFLPWHTPFSVARHVGLIRLDYLACYEMPPAIVSSRPELSVEALHRVAADAETLLAARQVRGRDAMLIGLSAGTYPATYLANRIGARLCAVAPSDRADRMIWESPATRLIKRRALMSGVSYSHYARAMRGSHPFQNLGGIASQSIFVMGRRDPFIPARRSAALLEAIKRTAPKVRVMTLDAGHVETMVLSAQYQYAMAGIERSRSWLRDCLSFLPLRHVAER
jgi:hypothetical protein